MSLLSGFQQKRVRPGTDVPAEVLQVRKQTLNLILNILAIVGTIAYFFSIPLTLEMRGWIDSAVVSALLIWLLAAAFLRNTNYQWRAMTLISLTFLFGLISLLIQDTQGYGFVILILFVMLSSLLLGNQVGLSAIVLSFAAISAVAVGKYFGWLNLHGFDIRPFVLSGWIAWTVVFLTTSALLNTTFNTILRASLTLVESLRTTSNELDHERKYLEERVQLRTKDLEHQAKLLEGTSQIASRISKETDQDELFRYVTDLIRQQFGFYHAGIFLLDPKEEFAVLRSASGIAGQKMLENGHRLKKGSQGIVGYVIDKNEARIALSVGQDVVHYKNPLLPDTQSEMALPIRSGNKVIGALDIQSTDENAFSENDVTILQSIADQLGVAIDRTNLLIRLKEELAELEHLSQKGTRQSWENYLRSIRKPRGYRFIPETEQIEAATSQYRNIEATEIQTGQTDPATGNPISIVNLPIGLRNQTIGVIKLKLQSASVPEDTMNFIQTAATRIGLALETARLLEELEIRAEREHLVSDISNKVRTSSDIENILKTTAEELGRVLGVTEVMVQLRPHDQQPEPGSLEVA